MSGWAALAQLGSGLIMNRHSSMLAEEREEDQRAWQEHMAKFQYQRTVADMRAAGLNPILAASKGFGPSQVPGTGSVGSPSSGGVDFAGAEAKLSSASAAKSQDLLFQQQIALAGEQATAARYDGLLKQAQAAETYARIPNVNADTANKILQAPLIQSQTEQTHAAARQADATTAKLKVEEQQLQETLKGLRVEGRIDETTYGEIMRLLGRVLPWSKR